MQNRKEKGLNHALLFKIHIWGEECLGVLDIVI